MKQKCRYLGKRRGCHRIELTGVTFRCNEQEHLDRAQPNRRRVARTGIEIPKVGDRPSQPRPADMPDIAVTLLIVGVPLYCYSHANRIFPSAAAIDRARKYRRGGTNLVKAFSSRANSGTARGTMTLHYL